MDVNYRDVNISYSHLDGAEKRISLSTELGRLKKKHKNINNLIHIYSHKAQYYNIEQINKKSFSTNINTYQNTENEPSSGVFLTTSNNVTKINPINNVKLNRLTFFKKNKIYEENNLSRSNYRSLESKKFPMINHPLDSADFIKKRENTHQKLKELNEREHLKKAMNAQKLKETNKVLRENLLMIKTRTL
jgi:hypothetical protein